MEQATPVRSYIIEAQDLFVPALSEALVDAGLEIVRVSRHIDLKGLLNLQPRVLFLDLDFIEDEPLETIRLLRTLLPEAYICVYTSDRSDGWSKECHFSGANAVFSKSAQRHELVTGIRSTLATGIYTDRRFTEEAR